MNRYIVKKIDLDLNPELCINGISNCASLDDKCVICGQKISLGSISHHIGPWIDYHVELITWTPIEEEYINANELICEFDFPLNLKLYMTQLDKIYDFYEYYFSGRIPNEKYAT